MAIRKREGRAKPWQVYWNNPWSKKRESKNFATEEEAKAYDGYIKKRLSFGKDVEGVEEPQKTSPKVQTSGTSNLTLRSVHLAYLKEKQFSKKGLLWQMDSMRYPLQQIGDKPVADITKGEIAELMTACMSTGVKPVTVRARFSVMRTVLRWAVDKGFRGPVDFPKLPPANYEKFVPPTPEELAAIMAVASPHIQRVIIIGSQCGVRIGPSELLQLTWADVDLTRRVLLVHGSKKNAKAPWREVPIRESLVPIFEQWKKEDEGNPVPHLIHYRGKTVTSITAAFRRTLRKAGISRRIRPYDLRHAFATEAIAAGIDIGTVANLMGHSSATMILSHYQYVMTKQKRAAVESLPDIGASYVPKMCPNPCAQKKNPYRNYL